MKQTKLFWIILSLAILFLIVGCGERTTVYQVMADEETLLKPGDTLDVLSLQIVAFAFDSSDPDGAVTVRWEADGEFGEGFMLAWDPDNPAPMPGQHGWVSVTDSEVREAQVKLSERVPHFFRICRIKDGACDVFSESVQVIFPEEALSQLDEQQDNNQEEEQATKTLPATPTTTEATLTPTPTTFANAEIEIESITTDADGIVTVTWKVLSGSAPFGFRVNWSNSTTNPTQNDTSKWVKDENARSLEIEGFGRGFEYHFSVCQALEDGGCGSITAGVTYKVPAESTKTTTQTPAITATPPSDEAGITLTTLQESGSGQVYLQWSANGSFPKGFKIVWSKSSSAPVFPGDSYAYINDGSVRSAYVKELTPGEKYYFRVCRYTGSACELYSNTKSITLSGNTEENTITLDSISDAGCGAAKLKWSATGSFPNGFKIAFSSSSTNPVYPGDDYVYVSSGSSRSVVVDGLTKGETYYFRVCKYEDGGCAFYSNKKSYTVPCTSTKTPTPTSVPTATPDSSTINLHTIDDEGCDAVRLYWTPSGDFPEGFKIVWSDVHANPVFPGDEAYYESASDATTVFLDGFELGTTYHFRICKFYEGACRVYSNAYEYTFPCD